jgi:ankyrin repeat protein
MRGTSGWNVAQPRLFSLAQAFLMRPPPDFYAAFCGFSGLAKRLIIAHAEDANAKCCARRSTPLYAASLGGRVDVAQVLFDHGADINARMVDGFVPLHFASLGGHRMVVQFLLEHGATVDAGDEYNETALYFALANGHLGVARLLLDHGADPNIQGSRNCWYDRPSGVNTVL